MIKSLKNAILFGIGAIDYSKEKLSESLNEFIENENLDKKEGRKLVEDVIKKATKEKSKQEKYIKKIIKDVMGELEVATKKDLKLLKRMETTKVVSKMVRDKLSIEDKKSKRSSIKKKKSIKTKPSK